MPATGDSGRLSNSYKSLHSGKGSYIVSSTVFVARIVAVLTSALIRVYPMFTWVKLGVDVSVSGKVASAVRVSYRLLNPHGR